MSKISHISWGEGLGRHPQSCLRAQTCILHVHMPGILCHLMPRHLIGSSVSEPALVEVEEELEEVYMLLQWVGSQLEFLVHLGNAMVMPWLL